MEIASKITNVSKSSPQKSSEIAEYETKNKGLERKIQKERHISPEKRQWIIDKIRLM